MGTPEQDFQSQVITTRHIRGLWAVVLAAAGGIGWSYNKAAEFGTWQANELNRQETLETRLKDIETRATLHKGSEHDKTVEARRKYLRMLAHQLEITHLELLKLVPPRKRDRIRDKLRAQRDKVTDALLDG